MQTKHKWRIEQPQLARTGTNGTLICAQREVEQRPLLAEQEVQTHTDELELLDRELKCDKQIKDEYLSIAAHELRTPITVIRAHAQMVERNIATRPDIMFDLTMLLQSVKIINEQTHRLSELVDNLLDPLSMGDGKWQLQREWSDLAELCREVVEDQRLLSGRVIELELPPAPVMLLLDRNRMNQVITNILNNALKYSPADLPVTVLVDQHDDVAVVRVSDAGPGIAEDQQIRIFEPFYRTPEAQASSRPGSGVGLAICKDIVEQHNGRIWCDSRVGEGSTFVVELPLLFYYG
ncbi:MAG TPA: HAMP domain-containing sensor histidine kinase [Ktedonobacteraceae bacterium]